MCVCVCVQTFRTRRLPYNVILIYSRARRPPKMAFISPFACTDYTSYVRKRYLYSCAHEDRGCMYIPCIHILYMTSQIMCVFALVYRVCVYR